MRLDRRPTWGKKHVRAPRDSKLKLEVRVRASRPSPGGHPLPIGFASPYDWGFVPGTLAPDGDPLNALVLSEMGSAPGIVIPCRPFGVLELEENWRLLQLQGSPVPRREGAEDCHQAHRVR